MNEERVVGIGRVPENARLAAKKMIWIGIWLAFMSPPLNKLLDGGYSTVGEVFGWTGLVVFVLAYLVLVFRHTARRLTTPVVRGTLVFLGALAVALSLTLGPTWLVLFVYVAVSCGAVLPARQAGWSIIGSTAVMCLLALRGDQPVEAVGGLLVPALLGGFAMTGVGQLIRTTVQLKEARATVAQLAANEERLRMSRDLHDLLGHSLSLIALKSELAGRMLPDQPGRAAAQIEDIQQVSRQALKDVREAVTGYRRPTLPGELAGARTALAAAGVVADVPADCPTDGLDEDQEAALAWALREGVTNVVRHSGARNCTVTVQVRQNLDGRHYELTVRDDGDNSGGSAAPKGNGLTGMTERLEMVGGTLDTRSGKGFTLTARVPLGSGT
ncbi:sensor histidine kinase [Streptomyces sp. NBC_01267]|nr:MULTISPECIES: sensor histidine kinase [unclassified Streptomyces]WSV54075.1 sensor histidine kinase [Streptomyces sp. NBC_01014]